METPLWDELLKKALLGEGKRGRARDGMLWYGMAGIEGGIGLDRVDG